MKYVSLFFALILLTFGTTIASAQPAANLVDECVADFDETVDYFPAKTEVEYAVGWSVEYFNHYKVVSVHTPWPGAAEDDAFQYVLVQCGTPVPDGYDDALIIDVPSGDIIALSTTYLPHLADLDLLDNLIGLDTVLFANTPAVVELIEAGELAEFGSGAGINVELVLDAEPGIVMTYGSGIPEYDAHPVLLEAGVPVVINAEYVETSPLGRAEWIKFTALFYNAEAEAEAVFGETVAAYDALVALAAEIPEDERRTLLWDSYTSFGDAWFVPGGASFSGQFLRDAGANLVLGDDPEIAGVTGSVPYDFETVYDAGIDADVWLPNAVAWYSLADVLAADPRYADLAAFQNGEVYNNSARENENGGNDFYETGVANPHLVLADLIYILYPDLLPEHELFFFEQLQ